MKSFADNKKISIFAPIIYIKMNWLNITYVIFWRSISFVSSFPEFLQGDCINISSAEDLLNNIFSPLFLWIIAFFGDYLYTIHSFKKETQILDEKWIKISYVLVQSLFVIFLLSIHTTCTCGRAICVILLYISMIGLKTASLYVLCPRQRVELV